jgi:uncharacterized protein YfdQ (DUF2303 family)
VTADAQPELLPAELLEVEDSAAAVAALATVAAKGVPLTRGTARAFLVPEGYQVEVVDLPHPPEPRRIVGTVELHTHAALADYVNEHDQQSGARVYADLPHLRLEAVINDDRDGMPDWRDHRAVVALQPTPEWTAWTGRSGRLTDQSDFSEFLEQHAHEIVHPDAATMIDVARTFQAKRDVSFRSAVRPTDGTVQVQYDEEIAGAAGRGAIDVPETLTIRVAPFYGAAEVNLTARFRYRINGGDLVLGYALLHVDRIRQQAFDQLLEELDDLLDDAPIRRGVAPTPRTDDGLR